MSSVEIESENTVLWEWRLVLSYMLDGCIDSIGHISWNRRGCHETIGIDTVSPGVCRACLGKYILMIVKREKVDRH